MRNLLRYNLHISFALKPICCSKELFLKSSQPVFSVLMLESHGKLEEAANIAASTHPSLLPRLLFKHGQKLEKQDDYLMALDKYNQVVHCFVFLYVDSVHRRLRNTFSLKKRVSVMSLPDNAMVE